MEAKEFIVQLRRALKPFVAAPSHLTAQQCLLRAASLRLVTPEQFDEAKSKHVAAARQNKIKEQWSALTWPAEAASQQNAMEETAQARARPDFVLRRLKNKDQHQSCIKMKLTTFCLDATLAAKLRDIAFDYGQLMAEASRLLNMYVLQRLEAGLDVNLETSNVVRQAIVMRRRVDERQVEIYGIKVCNHCVTTWDRDLNAARNILAIFLALRAGRPRPQVFRPTRARRQAAAG